MIQVQRTFRQTILLAYHMEVENEAYGLWTTG
jgi:hypothetical protein